MLVETTHLRASIQLPCLISEWPPAKCDVRSYIIAASPLSYIMCFCYESASFIRQLSPLFTVRTQYGDCLSRDTLNIYEESYMIRRSHVSRCICVSAVCSLFSFFFLLLCSGRFVVQYKCSKCLVPILSSWQCVPICTLLKCRSVIRVLAALEVLLVANCKTRLALVIFNFLHCQLCSQKADSKTLLWVAGEIFWCVAMESAVLKYLVNIAPFYSNDWEI